MSQSLLDSATRRAHVLRRGVLAEVVFDGQGAVLAFAAEWRQVERWAGARTASGNQVTDLGKLLARLEPMLVRRGTSLATAQGSAKTLASLAKEIGPAGLDISEWQIPAAVDELLNPPDPDDEDADAEPPAPPEPWYLRASPEAQQEGAEPENSVRVRSREGRSSRDAIDLLLARTPKNRKDPDEPE